MKGLFCLLAVLNLVFVDPSHSQTINCGEAVQRLQNYATQVNQIYMTEYSTTIPSQRCPAYDQWMRPFHPNLVQNCRLQMLAYLNNWYAQQCYYVNYWYGQISISCANRQPDTKPAPPVKRDSGSDEKETIDTEEIEELVVDVDEEKAVKITIPTTAKGFRGY